MIYRVAMFGSDLASLSAGSPPEHINAPPLSASSTDAAVKLAAPAQFRSSFFLEGKCGMARVSALGVINEGLSGF